MKVTRGDIPQNSLIQKYLPANYTDTYTCTVINNKNITPDDLQVAFWETKPAFVDKLFRLRNAIVKLVGLKTGEPDAPTIEECTKEGLSTDLFAVPDKNENETVAYLSDKHLDAYLSIHFRKNEDGTTTISLTTIVHFHQALGYIYFYTILPFHHLVVKKMMSFSLTRLLKD